MSKAISLLRQASNYLGHPGVGNSVATEEAVASLKAEIDSYLNPTKETQTFGQEAVGISFNPSWDTAVHDCKLTFASAIDQMNDMRNEMQSTGGKKRHASTAVTMLEDAQMRSVKALTWSGR